MIMVSPLICSTWLFQQLRNGLKNIRVLDGELLASKNKNYKAFDCKKKGLLLWQQQLYSVIVLIWSIGSMEGGSRVSVCLHVVFGWRGKSG